MKNSTLILLISASTWSSGQGFDLLDVFELDESLCIPESIQGREIQTVHEQCGSNTIEARYEEGLLNGVGMLTGQGEAWMELYWNNGELFGQQRFLDSSGLKSASMWKDGELHGWQMYTHDFLPTQTTFIHHAFYWKGEEIGEIEFEFGTKPTELKFYSEGVTLEVSFNVDGVVQTLVAYNDRGECVYAISCYPNGGVHRMNEGELKASLRMTPEASWPVSNVQQSQEAYLVNGVHLEVAEDGMVRYLIKED